MQPATAALCELILEARPHPEQGFRACLGIVRLAGPHGAERLQAAAERAINIGARTYGSVKSILEKMTALVDAPQASRLALVPGDRLGEGAVDIYPMIRMPAPPSLFVRSGSWRRHDIY